jgi:hypothetical protein
MKEKPRGELLYIRVCLSVYVFLQQNISLHLQLKEKEGMITIIIMTLLIYKLYKCSNSLQLHFRPTVNLYLNACCRTRR